MAPHATGDERSRGAPGRESRLSAEAVPWIVRAGAPRRDPPDMLGPWSSALRRFSRRSAKGVRHRILAAAADDGGPERLILDPAIARAHRHAAGARWGAQGQALGRPVRLVPTGGRGGDAPRAAAPPGADRPAVAPADAARDADHVRTAPGGTGATAATPDDPSRAKKHPLDRHLYKGRHPVERCLVKPERFRRAATRHGKAARNHRAVVTLAATPLWLR